MQLVGQRQIARAHVSGGPPTLRLGAVVPRRHGTSSTSLVVRSVDASTATSSALAEPAPPSSPEPMAATAPSSSDTELQRPEQRKPRRNRGARSDSKKPGSESGAAAKPSRLSKDDRQFIAQRRDALVKGEAVGMTMQPTVADVATGFRGLRPLASELARRDRTLLFFPTSSRPQPQPQPQETATDAPNEQAPAATAAYTAEQKDKEANKQQQPRQPRNLELALVAVTKFEAPQPEVIIRVGASSSPEKISRTLCSALDRSGSVAIHAAGPGAGLVALQAAVFARRTYNLDRQLDLAFSIEYLTVPAMGPGPNAPPAPAAPAAADAAAPADAAAAAAVPAAPAPAAAAPAAKEGAAAAADGAAAAGPSPSNAPGAVASVLQFSFYKRTLPSPEINLADYAASRSGPDLRRLLVSLMAERSEVELKMHSRDALFAMTTLAGVVRESWTQNKASVAAFLTDLQLDPPSEESASSTEDSGSSSSSSDKPFRKSPRTGSEPFTATLTLRRIAGAPNFVIADSEKQQRVMRRGSQLMKEMEGQPQGAAAKAAASAAAAAAVGSLLGPPMGLVRFDSPVEALGKAIDRELENGGSYSVLPEEGVCVARALRALWAAQTARRERAEAVDAAAGTAAEAEAAAEGAVGGGSDGGAVSIAVIPEQQYETRNSSRKVPRATVLQMLEVTPMLTPALRNQDGTVLPMSGGAALTQLAKAVVLRNKLYGDRPRGKLLVMRPQLDEAGSLQVQLELVPAEPIAAAPEPLPPKRKAAAVSAAAAAMVAAPVAGDYQFDTDEEGVAMLAVASESDDEAAGAPAGVAMMPILPKKVLELQQQQKEEEERKAKGEEEGQKEEEVAAASVLPPRVLSVAAKTPTRNLAMALVAEACKSDSCEVPVWVRLLPRPEAVGVLGLALAMAQQQVQERTGGYLQALPVLDRLRDQANRPYIAFTWKVIRAGVDKEKLLASAAKWAEQRDSQKQNRKDRKERKDGKKADKEEGSEASEAVTATPTPVPAAAAGPTEAAMAAAMAAAVRAAAPLNVDINVKLW